MSTNSWSDKDGRQYREIKRSAIERGRSEVRAEQLAARTVSKLRGKEGRTETRRSMAVGSSNRPLEARTKDELINRARALYISGRNRMTKAELIRAIQEKR